MIKAFAILCASALLLSVAWTPARSLYDWVSEGVNRRNLLGSGESRDGRRRRGQEDEDCPLRNTDSENELDLRFNKIPGDTRPEPKQELGRMDYPITPETFEWMRETDLVSVREETKYCPECYCPLCHLVKAIGGFPHRPSSELDHPFWTEEMQPVVDWQVLRRARGSVDAVDLYMPTPDTWKVKYRTVDEAAEAVHDEYPGSHHEALIVYLLKAGMKVNKTMIPPLTKKEFVRGIVALSDLNTWAFGCVGPINFSVKYFVGQARPEEVAWKIFNGEIAAPQNMTDAIKAMDLEDATSFTAYPEGSPGHPSFPAMHSASSVSSLWLAVVMDLSEEMWCQAMLTDYAVATARTVAGVHYPSDNIGGLKLGQKILADHLPEHLAETYGADKKEVQRRIISIFSQHDWDNFENSDCYKRGLDPSVVSSTVSE